MSLKKQLREGVMALALLGPVLGAAPAAAAEVRAWDHGDYGRLVFDWGRKVDYRIDTGPTQLYIDFDAPVEASLAGPLGRLSTYVASGSVAGDGTDVVLALHRPVTVRSFVLGSRIVVDLRRATGTGATVAAPAAAPAPAARPAAPTGTVSVTADQRPGFSRLTFDWRAPVSYAVDRDGNRVTLAFDRPGTADLSAVDQAALRDVAGIRADQAGGRLSVTLDLQPGRRLRHYADGGKVIVDLLDGAAASRQVAATAPAAGGDRQPGAPASLVPGAPTPIAPAPSPAAAAPRQPAPAAPASRPAAPAPARQAPAATPGPAAPVAKPAAAPTTAAPAAARQQRAAQGELRAVLQPGVPTHAAVFLRGGHLWIVLASAQRIDQAALAAQAAALGPVQIVDAQGGVALRIPAPVNRRPAVTRDGTRWTVTLSAGAQDPSRPLDIRPQPAYVMGSRLLVAAEGARGVVRFVDPEAGDVLIAAPLPDAGMGLPVGRRFAQVGLLPSAQGLVAQHLAEGVSLRVVSEGIEITARTGLLMSSMTDRRIAADQPLPVDETYLHIVEWQRRPADYNTTRQELVRQIADADDAGRARARLALARLYFAYGFGAEALPLLDQLVEEEPKLLDRADFRLMRGAARALAGDLEQARVDLMQRSLEDSPEAAMWRGAVAAAAGNWAEAAQAFNQAGPLLGEEPQPMPRYLTLPAALAAIETGDVDTAAWRLTRLSAATDRESDTWPAVIYITGRIQLADGNHELAKLSFARAATSSDQLYRIRGEMALTQMEIEDGTITALEAAQRLEGLQYGWRGDDLEQALMRQIGDAYWLAKHYREALDAWERAIAVFPGRPAAAEIQRDRAEKVVELFSPEVLEKLSPVAAASLYQDYGRLLPGGAEGDAIARRLSEKLAGVDMLDPAGDLLQKLMDDRPPGAEKAELGARLAGIRLLDGKPRAALAALDASEAPGVSAALAFQRRLLRARSLSELGRPDDALALLAGDNRPLAIAAVLDIAWRAERWADAAAALEQLVGKPPTRGQAITEEQARLVLNLGIARALANDRRGLDRLSEAFGPAMGASRHASIFALLTRPTAPLGPLADLAAVRREVAEVDLFQKFLASYRSTVPLTN